MRMRQMLLLLVSVGWFASQAAAQQPFFIEMADPQFGMYTNNHGFAQETANLEFAIATANRLQPRFVVIAGDLVNKSGDPAQIAEYRRVTKQLTPDIPLYNVAGNHDVGNNPTAASLEAYRKNFGKDYYSFRSGEVVGIVLDSSIIQHPEQVPDEEIRQRDWLQQELKSATAHGARQIVIFQHIPWFLHDAEEPDQYFNIPHDIRARYLKIFADAGIHYVFAGHFHQNSEANVGALRMVTTGPVGKPQGNASSGLRIVTIGHGKLCDHYYGFGNLPNQVDGTVAAACEVAVVPTQ
jgi:3',5'-cyclic AMP phosphodiesterase CpdA